MIGCWLESMEQLHWSSVCAIFWCKALCEEFCYLHSWCWCGFLYCVFAVESYFCLCTVVILIFLKTAHSCQTVKAYGLRSDLNQQPCNYRAGFIATVSIFSLIEWRFSKLVLCDTSILCVTSLKLKSWWVYWLILCKRWYRYTCMVLRSVAESWNSLGFFLSWS